MELRDYSNYSTLLEFKRMFMCQMLMTLV